MTGACAIPASGAFVNLTLFNSFALLDVDDSTPLQGNASAGDLVQLVLAGANGVADIPDESGDPANGDSLLPASLANNPTHVGAGLPGSNHGLLYQVNLLYDTSYVGRSVFVRFWNGGQPWTATHYAQTAIFTLPAGDVFGEAEYDFRPSAGATSWNAFEAEDPVHVPEPRLFAFGACVLALLARLRTRMTTGEYPA
jgi:hypothetical protein